MKTIYSLLFSKKKTKISPDTLWRYYKTYCDSLTKLIESLLASPYNKSSGIQFLFNLYNHCMTKWTKLITFYNNSHQIEIYFRHMLLLAINKATFYLRLSLPNTSALIIDSVTEIYEAAKTSTNPHTQHICGRYIAAKANLFMEYSMMRKAIDYYMLALKHFHSEIKVIEKKYTNLQLIERHTRELHTVQRNV